MVQSDQERRLLVLRTVSAAGGRLLPQWNPLLPRGFAYAEGLDAPDAALLERDLVYLAERDYLEQVFADHLSRCPSCASHHLNVREVCISCKSANIVSEPLLHHYRCAYVGPMHMFALARGGRRCPKCSGLLEHIGTEYDSPGEYFTCRACTISFQEPEVEAFCLSCGTRTLGADLATEDVFAFQLTSLGQAALRDGRLFDDDKEIFYEIDVPVLYRRHVLFVLVQDERQRFMRYQTAFSLILLGLFYKEGERQPETERLMVEKLLNLLRRDCDKIGRCDSNHLLVFLPLTDPSGAAVVLARIVQHTQDLADVIVTGQVLDPLGDKEIEEVIRDGVKALVMP